MPFTVSRPCMPILGFIDFMLREQFRASRTFESWCLKTFEQRCIALKIQVESHSGMAIQPLSNAGFLLDETSRLIPLYETYSLHCTLVVTLQDQRDEQSACQQCDIHEPCDSILTRDMGYKFGFQFIP